MGKTTLWAEGLRLAASSAFALLTARAAQAENQLAFVTIGDLVSPVLEAVADALPPVQRRALETALVLREPSGAPPSTHAVGLGVLSVVRELAREHPVLVAVDDVQWADGASLEVLAFLIRRLRHEPVGVLLAVRGSWRDVGSELMSALPERRTVAVKALSLDDTRRLLADRIELRLSRPQLATLHRAAEGNAFLALELGRAVLEGGIDLSDDPLVVPPSAMGLVATRLERLPDSVRETLAAVAALAGPTMTLLESWSREAIADIELAVDRQLVLLEGDRLRFSHPLLASACYGALSLHRRRRLHQQLAALEVGLEERARHLAIAARGPDDTVAASLDDAAASAAARGAVQAAARFARRAVAMTVPSDLDPLNRRRISAAHHSRAAGDPAAATVLLQAVIDTAEPGPVRARAFADLAQVRGAVDGFRMAENLYLLALDEPGVESGERARLLGELAWQVSAGGYQRESARYAEAGLDLAQRCGDPVILASSLAGVAELTFWRTGVLRADLLERAVALEREVDGDLDARGTLARLLARCDRFTEARELFGQLIGAGRAKDGREALGPLIFLARMELAAGDWSATERLCNEAIAVAGQAGEELTESLGRMLLAELDAYQGRADIARREIPALREQAQAAGFTGSVHRLSRALGTLELSCGNPIESLRQVAPLLTGLSELNVVQAELAGSVGIEALAGTDDVSGAQRLLTQLDALASDADAPLRLLAHRSCGHLRAAQGDHDAAVEAFEQACAVPVLPQGTNPFELARAQLGLGASLRRAQRKRAARDVLRASAEGFADLGASTWAAKARSELRRIGGRTASPQGLSETERLIAERVAAGQRNGEVAADLHLSPNTVSWNLSKIYRKLGVTSRTELAAHLSRTPPE